MEGRLYSIIWVHHGLRSMGQGCSQFSLLQIMLRRTRWPCAFHFKSYRQITSSKDCTSLHSCQHYFSAPSSLLDSSNLMGRKRWFMVAFICVFLNTERLGIFMCIWLSLSPVNTTISFFCPRIDRGRSGCFSVVPLRTGCCWCRSDLSAVGRFSSFSVLCFFASRPT